MYDNQGPCSHETHILISEQEEEINDRKDKLAIDFKQTRKEMPSEEQYR